MAPPPKARRPSPPPAPSVCQTPLPEGAVMSARRTYPAKCFLYSAAATMAAWGAGALALPGVASTLGLGGAMTAAALAVGTPIYRAMTRRVRAQDPLPEQAVTPGWRTYPADCLLYASVASVAAWVVDAFVFPGVASTLDWFGSMEAAALVVGAPIYQVMTRRITAQGVVIPSLLDGFNAAVFADESDYAGPPPHEPGQEPERVISSRRDPHRLE